MRRGMVLWLAAIVAFCGLAANAAVISESLQGELQKLSAGENVRALAYFNSQADLLTLNQQLKQEKATLAERNRRVIEALQSVATQTQPEMVAFLENLKSQGMVREYKMFWIANMLWVDASAAGIQALASHPALMSITWDYPVENIQPPKTVPSNNLITGHEVGLDRINAPAAWAQGWTGAGRVVMNIDTGVDGTHPALADRFRGDVDGDGDYDESWLDPYDTHWTFPQDSGYHGTHTMGTICGRTPSGDTIGVAIDAEWIAAAPIDRESISRTIQDILTSFQWAVDPDGDPNTQDNADAIGNSWGIPDGFGYPDCDETFWTAIDNVEIAGSAVIFSAGNEGSNGLRSPADRATTYYNCFSVGAVDGNNPNLPIASFSARGPSECAGGDLAIKPEVVAPGVHVRSSMPGNSYGYLDGTSMSSPHITGSVAIIRQVNPDLDVDTIKEILMATAHDLPFNNPDGEDNTYGHGIIDVYEACLVAQTGYGFVQGMVTNSGGEGIGGALVEVAGAPRFTYADDSGHYEIGLPADTTYTMRASFFGYLPAEAEAEVVAEETTYVDFELLSAPSGSLHGTVTNVEDSSPIEGANLEVVGAPIDPVQTDENGYYVFAALPGDQTYTIRATANNFDVGQDDVYVPTGGDAELNFALTPFESFENGNGGWIGHGAWEWGQPTSGPGSAYNGVNVWATELNGDYSNNADDSVKTLVYTIDDSNASLSFYQWYEIENSWDGGNVSISTDGGASWIILQPEGGYPDDNINGLDGDPGFTGTSGGWVRAAFDIGAYQGADVMFMFRFGTDGSVTYSGWYLDAVVVSGATPFIPNISVNPMSFSVQLEQGESADRTLNIGNVGEGMLYYDITPITSDRRLRYGGGNDTPDPIESDPYLGKQITFQRDGDMLTVTYDGPKINFESGSSPNPPVVADFGGPDEFGYRWIDSDEPDGPEFNWVDISGIGEPLTFSDDQNRGPFDLGFSMQFYDGIFSTIRICSNGFVSFTSTSTTYNNASIPNTSQPNNLVAPFWDDLNPSDGGMIYYYTNDVDSAIVSWVEVPHYDFTGPGLYTFEVILLASGDIVYQYASLEGEVASNTIGIEDANGVIGLPIAFNNEYVQNEMAVQIKFPTFWLTVDPRSGENGPGESSDFTVTFDASELDDGTYTGYLSLDSNDPENSTMAVQCTLIVGQGTEVDPSQTNIPSTFALNQNFPNPFNPTTEIGYALPAQSDVELVIYDMLGRKVRTLVDRRMQAGYHSVMWDGTDKSGNSVSSGIYFFSIKAGDFSLSRKMIMLK